MRNTCHRNVRRAEQQLHEAPTIRRFPRIAEIRQLANDRIVIRRTTSRVLCRSGDSRLYDFDPPPFVLAISRDNVLKPIRPLVRAPGNRKRAQTNPPNQMAGRHNRRTRLFSLPPAFLRQCVRQFIQCPPPIRLGRLKREKPNAGGGVDLLRESTRLHRIDQPGCRYGDHARQGRISRIAQTHPRLKATYKRTNGVRRQTAFL